MHRLMATRRYDAGMGRIARRSVLAAAVIWSLSVPIAGAQQYEDEVGDLDLVVTVSITVTMSGEGYVGDSVVYVALTSEDGEQVVELGTIPTDDQGRFFGEIVLPDDLEPGTYTIAATGVTGQGATRVLSTSVAVGQDVALVATTTTTSTTTVASSEVTATVRPQRGSGLDPLPEITPSEPDDDSSDRVFLANILAASLIPLGGLWWWLYRVTRRRVV
jgi:methionine-rich copper-binding protein CopC